jgi:Ca-activated chloride channel family protein
VDQVFRNDGPTAVEGTYLFPLPPGAVVEEFTMWIDGQPVESKILRAEEARAIYESYVRRQQDPALLEYVGREAVQARIFPIPPEEERRIELEYRQVLRAEDGLLHYRYALDTERFSAYPLEQVSVHVRVRSQTPLHAVYSPTHQDEVLIQREGQYEASISYEANDVLPDRDFELYVGFGDEEIGAHLLSYQPATEEGFFLLILSPQIEVDEGRILPKDIFLVLDTSGSMEGEKLQQAKEALRYVLRHLNPEDRFNVVAFSSSVRSYAPRLRPASEADAAAAWVSDLEAIGGTNIYLALTEAVVQADTQRPTVLIFLTDGLPTEGVIDEETLLGALEQEAPDSVRIFPFGVGYDVNTLLLDELAEEHRGRPAYVQPEERIDEEVSKFYARVQSPILTDIALDFEGIDLYDLYPQPLPDLFAGTQLIVAGRYTGEGSTSINLTGMVEGQETRYTYQGELVAEGGADFIPRLWAARKIGYLLTQIRLHGEQEEWIDAVVTLSLRYGIITPYTSFLIEEEDVLTSTGRDEAADGFWYQEPPAVAGEDAVEEAEERLGLGGAEAPPTAYKAPEEGEGATAPEIRYAGDKTFFCEQERCVDTAFVPDQMEPQAVRFGSEIYWEIAAARPEWAHYLSLAPEVIFVREDGTALHVQTGESVEEDEISLPEVTSSPEEPPAPSPSSPPEITIEAEESGEAAPASRRIPLCSSAYALLLVLVVCWIIRRR